MIKLIIPIIVVIVLVVASTAGLEAATVPALQDEHDWGDAPDDPMMPRYPTLSINSGANHLISPGMFMGSTVDGELDGQPNSLALGDDWAGTDDEDGVIFTTALVPSLAASVDVITSTGGYINAWIDFDRDGGWSEIGDQIISGAMVAAGTTMFTFTVPATASSGSTMARFRFSSTQSLSYDGYAPDGEVEDYVVGIGKSMEPRDDLGDAPDSSNTSSTSMTAYPGPPGTIANFPTVYIAGSPPFGPIHRNAADIAYLGTGVSGEVEADIGPDTDGLNNIDPSSDRPDQDGFDDALSIPLCLKHCDTAARFNYIVTVTSNYVNMGSPKLYVNAWFDWNRDGDWDDMVPDPVCNVVPEWAVRNQTLTFAAAGTYTITSSPFTVYSPTVTAIWMRLSLSEQPWAAAAGTVLGDGGSGPAIGYAIGETEDFYFTPSLPVIVKAGSVKTQGVAGTFAVDICAGKTECRSGGPTKVIVTYDRNVQQVTGTTADITLSSGMVSSVGISGTELTITMNGVANAAPLTIGFPGIADAGNINCLVPGPICLRVLNGDVNSDGRVNVQDMLMVRNEINRPVTANNFRSDLTVDGKINVQDMLLVRMNINRLVGACSGPYCP